MFDKLAVAKKAAEDANRNEKLGLTAEDLEDIICEECFDYATGPDYFGYNDGTEGETRYYNWWYHGAIEAAKSMK